MRRTCPPLYCSCIFDLPFLCIHRRYHSFPRYYLLLISLIPSPNRILFCSPCSLMNAKPPIQCLSIISSFVFTFAATCANLVFGDFPGNVLLSVMASPFFRLMRVNMSRIIFQRANAVIFPPIFYLKFQRKLAWCLHNVFKRKILMAEFTNAGLPLTPNEWGK